MSARGPLTPELKAPFSSLRVAARQRAAYLSPQALFHATLPQQHAAGKEAAAIPLRVEETVRPDPTFLV